MIDVHKIGYLKSAIVYPEILCVYFTRKYGHKSHSQISEWILEKDTGDICWDERTHNHNDCQVM